MQAIIFYVCFVLFVVCALAVCWILYSGGKVCEKSEKLLNTVEYYVFRGLIFVASVCLIGVAFNWPGGV